ncbi:hypothetical protein AVEN_129210-1 [Araneus ventricosus]|uniref:Uncharacterized protein n=1 Tax=Araneus ventricosus TaxID=182803 RepID=A0A4Y2IBV2_ARAVE|nr:hypothetical protein AVEN_129210-1 [Araneus ventricosus]
MLHVIISYSQGQIKSFRGYRPVVVNLVRPLMGVPAFMVGGSNLLFNYNIRLTNYNLDRGTSLSIKVNYIHTIHIKHLLKNPYACVRGRKDLTSQADTTEVLLDDMRRYFVVAMSLTWIAPHSQENGIYELRP